MCVRHRNTYTFRRAQHRSPLSVPGLSVPVSLAANACGQEEAEADYTKQFPDHFAAHFGDLEELEGDEAVPMEEGPGVSAKAGKGVMSAAKEVLEGSLLDDVVLLHAR